MNLKQLITHIKNEGCRIKIWRKKKYIGGSAGTFHVTDAGPLINLATKGESKKKVVMTLLHEYGHFLQWKDGFLPCIDNVCETYDIHYNWLNGHKTLTALEWSIARNAMLWIEWDAEVRGYNLGKSLGIDGFDARAYLKGAIAYMISIKWSWDNRSDWKICVPKRHIKNPKIYTTEKLFAPLTKTEKALTKFIKG